MTDVPDYSIPEENLPEGFAQSIARIPEDPPTPRPAATIVVLRDPEGNAAPSEPGTVPEVLLMRRSRSSGFVPGAYVFPGGRVDPNEASPEVLDRIRDLTPEAAAARLDYASGPSSAVVDAIDFYVAALREAFEETGLLVAQRNQADQAPPSAATSPEIERLRVALMADEMGFGDVLQAMDTWIEGSEVSYLAHWITPVQEPRRYDARFFVAGVPAGTEVVIDEREMVDARWLQPTHALELNRAGELPMVFPTIHTLEMLTEFGTVAEVVAAFQSRRVPSILPRLVRTRTGIGLEVAEEI